MKKYKVGLVLEKMLAESLFSAGDMSFLASIADVNPIQALPETVSREYMMETLEGADVAITCWRTPAFTEEMLQSLPRLRLIAHAAGSVKNLVPPSFWTSGRRITSNAPVIAEDVAQTTLALILTSLKQLWQLNASTAAGEWKGGESGAFTTRRLDGLSVGIVGASLVGREVLRILQPFHCRLLLADPYLSPLEAENLGAELLPLEDLIRQSDVLTLHAPANEDWPPHTQRAKFAPAARWRIAGQHRARHANRRGGFAARTAHRPDHGLLGRDRPRAARAGFAAAYAAQRRPHAAHRGRTHAKWPPDDGAQHPHRDVQFLGEGRVEI